MKVHQWEIWKARPEGFQKDHWFVIVSGQERLDSTRHSQVNALACFSLRGEPLKTDVPRRQFASAICSIFWTNASFIRTSAASVGNGSNKSKANSRKC